MAEYKQANLFLNNDESGRKAAITITKAGILTKDNSSLYHGYKDVNEYLNAKKLHAGREKMNIFITKRGRHS